MTNAPPPCQVKEQDNDHDEQVNNINKIEKGVPDTSIPSAVADSGATSSVRIKRDRNKKAFTPIGCKSDKAFRMPNGKVEEASNMDELHHDVRHPAKDIHIVPGIERNSLLSISKFVDANYVVIFDKDKVNIFDLVDIFDADDMNNALFRHYKERESFYVKRKYPFKMIKLNL